MSGTDAVEIQCPYCGETIGIVVDLSVEDQSYIEDCQVCCQMWRVQVRYKRSGRADVSVERADESSYE